jgi:hypothetical protein
MLIRDLTKFARNLRRHEKGIVNHSSYPDPSTPRGMVRAARITFAQADCAPV